MIVTGQFLLPMAAMVVLTMVVLLTLLTGRVRHANANKIDPQQMHSPEATTSLMPESANNVANNFKNLFEMPVLFYVVCLMASLTGPVAAWMVGLAWAYVALRAAHSVVQCTYNTVMHRLGLFALSNFVLTAMLIVVIIRAA